MKRLLGLLLVMGIVGCGGGDVTTTQPDASAKPLPDAATVKQTLTPAQLAVGDPIENSVGMVLVPIPVGEFLMGSPETPATLLARSAAGSQHWCCTFCRCSGSRTTVPARDPNVPLTGPRRHSGTWRLNGDLLSVARSPLASRDEGCMAMGRNLTLKIMPPLTPLRYHLKNRA